MPDDYNRLQRIMTALDLPDDQYAIAGSGALVLNGVERTRPMGDLDIFIATRTWFGLYHEPDWSVFTTDPNDRKRRCDPPYLFKTIEGLEVNVFSEWRKRGHGDINVGQWIYSAVLAGGWPCVRLDFLLDWKESVGRDKDLSDISAIKRHLGLQLP